VVAGKAVGGTEGNRITGIMILNNLHKGRIIFWANITLDLKFVVVAGRL